MQTLAYVSRRLHIFGRPKRAFVQPLVFFAWKKLLYAPRAQRPWSRFYRPRHLTHLPAMAGAPLPVPYEGGRTLFLYYTSRRVRAQVRHKSLPSVPVTPALFSGASTKYLYYVSRGLRTYTNRHHNKARYAFSGGIIPPPPVTIDAGSGISGGYFSRGKWHALVGELAKEAHERADKLRRKKEREALAEAAEAALKAAGDADVFLPGTQEMINVHRELQFATSARHTADMFGHIAIMHEHIARMQRQIDDDEDEAISLLLLS